MELIEPKHLAQGRNDETIEPANNGEISQCLEATRNDTKSTLNEDVTASQKQLDRAIEILSGVGTRLKKASIQTRKLCDDKNCAGKITSTPNLFALAKSQLTEAAAVIKRSEYMVTPAESRKKGYKTRLAEAKKLLETLSENLILLEQSWGMDSSEYTN